MFPDVTSVLRFSMVTLDSDWRLHRLLKPITQYKQLSDVSYIMYLLRSKGLLQSVDTSFWGHSKFLLSILDGKIFLLIAYAA